MKLFTSYFTLLALLAFSSHLSGMSTDPDTVNILSADTTFAVLVGDTLPGTLQDSSAFEEDIYTDSPIDTTGTFDLLIRDSQILRAIDSMTYLKFYNRQFFISDSAYAITKSKFAIDDIPDYPDSVYASRIEKLNKQTPIELTYNKEVKNYIYLYANKKRNLTARMLGLAEIYFPMFEAELDRFNMPLEIKYLAIVESALNPAAGSRMGAKGLWQFMYGTGKVYDLKVTSLVDDRYDPLKSTVAACEHLTDLFEIYGDWSLVLAAYNSGAGNVNRAIRRAGGTKNYWAVWPFLPRETRGYVPAFIAVNYIMNYAPEHNIYPMRPGSFYYDVDTVTVTSILAFDQLNEMMGIPLDELRFLNPQFKMGIVPATDGKTYILRIPHQFVDNYITNEDSLYAFKTKKGVEHDQLMAEVKKARDRNIHIVRSGESLGIIAKRNHVYVSQIKHWNNLKNNTIYPGQKLVLFGSGTVQYESKSGNPVVRSGEQSSHVVKNGENLGLIAKKYQCSVTDLKEWNNLKSNNIYPNQSLTVYKPESKKSNSVTKGKYLYHVVRKGDTLWDIAKEYDGVTVDQIKALNKMHNINKLKPGQKIIVAEIG
ncbi:MAG: LysM peptidoglycan-binding domain-containing protein [Bacteroidales bacterium]|nr:LysM peptidoglycan-binding domain-containing protein [Bacteroidales bacterium]